jgi:hypothetical protein
LVAQFGPGLTRAPVIPLKEGPRHPGGDSEGLSPIARSTGVHRVGGGS